jgi:hypothetical protein
MAMSLLIVEGNLFQSRLTEKQRVTKRFCYGATCKSQNFKLLHRRIRPLGTVFQFQR